MRDAKTIIDPDLAGRTPVTIAAKVGGQGDPAARLAPMSRHTWISTRVKSSDCKTTHRERGCFRKISDRTETRDIWTESPHAWCRGDLSRCIGERCTRLGFPTNIGGDLP